MLFSIFAMAAIILAASFGLRIIDVAPGTLPAGVDSATVLYVCPAATGFFDSFATAIRPMVRYINMGSLFSLILLAASWSWALYQGMLADKFQREKFANSWFLTKVWFWIMIVTILLTNTPNFFRRVEVNGMPGQYIMCDATATNAVPVYASGVRAL